MKDTPQDFKYPLTKYCFSHKDGKVHHGDRLSLIAYDNKVTRKGLSKVITGLRKTHYGWSLVN